MNGNHARAKIDLEAKWNTKAKLGLVRVLISDEIPVLHLETGNLSPPGEAALNVRSPNPPNGEAKRKGARSTSQGKVVGGVSLPCVHAPGFHLIST